MRLHQQLLDFGDGVCHVMVIPGTPHIVVATEMQEGSGASISHACETLAATIQNQLLPAGNDFRLLLHDPDTPPPDHVTEVTFDRRHGKPGVWEFEDPDWVTMGEPDLRAPLHGQLPRDPLELTDAETAQLADIRARQQREDDAWMTAERASFQAIELQGLPSTDEVNPTVPDADWPAVAHGAVAILGEGVDPLDRTSVRRAVQALGLPALEAGLLASLFRDPIVVAPGDDRFTSGRHRTQAMRQAGVVACVINTRAGHRMA